MPEVLLLRKKKFTYCFRKFNLQFSKRKSNKTISKEKEEEVKSILYFHHVWRKYFHLSTNALKECNIGLYVLVVVVVVVVHTLFNFI